jgi:periplasmic divalent cation tolerance protein
MTLALNEFQLLLCTCPDQETASRIASALVEQRLAACVNILPGVRSVYRWQAAIEWGDEQLLLIKSRATRYGDIEAAIKALHPYELPEVIAVPISAGLPAYLAWIKESSEDVE